MHYISRVRQTRRKNDHSAHQVAQNQYFSAHASMSVQTASRPHSPPTKQASAETSPPSTLSIKPCAKSDTTPDKRPSTENVQYRGSRCTDCTARRVYVRLTSSIAGGQRRQGRVQDALGRRALHCCDGARSARATRASRV